MNVEDTRTLAEVARRAEETVAGLNGSVEASVALLGDVTMVVEFVDGGEKVGHFGGRKGASSAVTLWAI